MLIVVHVCCTAPREHLGPLGILTYYFPESSTFDPIHVLMHPIPLWRSQDDSSPVVLFECILTNVHRLPYHCELGVDLEVQTCNLIDL